MKGTDAQRAILLAAAAETADCDHTLALAGVHETWSAYDPERRYRRRSRADDWGDDAFDADGSDDYELEELIESEVRLESWIRPPRRSAGDREPRRRRR